MIWSLTAVRRTRTGFILDKQIGVNCPKRIENAKILIANTCRSETVWSA